MPQGPNPIELLLRRCCALLSCAICTGTAAHSSPAHAAPDLGQPPLPMIARQLSGETQPEPLPVAPVRAIFRVEKSENRNQVHYGAHVDSACRPLGASPIYAYWRMLERGPELTEELLEREQPGYGLLPRQLVSRAARGGSVRVRLRAWPDRPIRVELFQHGVRCMARALLDIQREPAVIQSIYIDIGFLFSVRYALVRGIRLADGHAVHEKLTR